VYDHTAAPHQTRLASYRQAGRKTSRTPSRGGSARARTGARCFWTRHTAAPWRCTRIPDPPWVLVPMRGPLSRLLPRSRARPRGAAPRAARCTARADSRRCSFLCRLCSRVFVRALMCPRGLRRRLRRKSSRRRGTHCSTGPRSSRAARSSLPPRRPLSRTFNLLLAPPPAPGLAPACCARAARRPGAFPAAVSHGEEECAERCDPQPHRPRSPGSCGVTTGVKREKRYV
jgi:hypothetical protein